MRKRHTVHTELPRTVLVHGDGAFLHLLADRSADMVLTSPPYFDEDKTGPLLEERVYRQTQTPVVRQQLAEFAQSLVPVFNEAVRVLRPGGVLALQTKDIRYGGFLLSLAETHRQLIEARGLCLLTRVGWRKFSHRLRRSASFQKTQAVGSFLADETEDFLIFTHPCGLRQREGERVAITGERVAITAEEAHCWSSPLWESPGAGGAATHPHQAPSEPIRRLIQLYTLPGDLVVDPFAGHATTLIEAARLGRCSVGYELDEARAHVAQAKIERLWERDLQKKRRGQ